jgi:hypothetical protein
MTLTQALIAIAIAALPLIATAAIIILTTLVRAIWRFANGIVDGLIESTMY